MPLGAHTPRTSPVDSSLSPPASPHLASCSPRQRFISQLRDFVPFRISTKQNLYLNLNMGFESPKTNDIVLNAVKSCSGHRFCISNLKLSEISIEIFVQELMSTLHGNVHIQSTCHAGASSTCLPCRSGSFSDSIGWF
jgi:hypothetical protein